MKSTNHFALFFALFIQPFPPTFTDNVLFLSLPYYGHLNPMVKVAGQLAKYGHHSHILIPERFDAKFTPLKKEIHYIFVEEFQEFKEFNDSVLGVLANVEKSNFQDCFFYLHRLCDRYLFDKELFQKLNSVNASLAIVDANFVSNCLAIFAYKLEIPFILQGLHNQIRIHQTPWSFSIFPHFAINQDKVTTFRMKLFNIWAHLNDFLTPLMGSPGRKIKEYAPERPDISFIDLMHQAELYIVDSDHFLHVPLPALPNVKYIGGIAIQPAEPLKGEILRFIEASKHGVVVVSPGSLVSWGERVQKMEEAFSKIKYDVVWKHSNSSFSRRNVFLTKWLPQNDLLGHRNTKLFITHCGNSGQYESLYHAVPMIGFPVLADQIFNGRNLQKKKFGLSMDIFNYTVDELVANIEEVIENPIYKENIAKLSEIYRYEKELPSEKTARYVDQILKYGGSHLRSEIQSVSLYEFYMLDVWAFLLSSVFLILSVFIILLRKGLFIVFRTTKIKKE